ncbi:MAG: isochorismatase family protein [Fervidicoccaceae archaeon]|jgi:ribose 5-phosphate isomerase B
MPLGKRVAIGSDDLYTAASMAKQYLESLGYEIYPVGSLKTGKPEPWPEVGREVGLLVSTGKVDWGIVVCYTGTGVSIAANKVKGVRAALCNDPETARGARLWNDANILAMSGRLVSDILAKEILKAWISVEGPEESERENIAKILKFEADVKGRTAVLVIDMLKEFVTGRLGSERARRIVSPLSEFLEKAREAGAFIIYVKDSHLPRIDFELRKWGDHAIKGSEDAEIVRELSPKEGDYVIEKRRYSAFFMTDLDLLLRELGVDTLILTGVSTDICVMHTAADAFYRGYRIIVPRDLVESMSEEGQEKGLKAMKELYGAEIVTSSEALNIIKGRNSQA